MHICSGEADWDANLCTWSPAETETLMMACPIIESLCVVSSHQHFAKAASTNFLPTFGRS